MRITKWVIATGFALAMTHILFVHIVCSYILPGMQRSVFYINRYTARVSSAMF